MTNDRPVYILQLANFIVYWPLIGHLYCMTSFLMGPIGCFRPTVPKPTKKRLNLKTNL